jgi:hypothetical protein
MQAWANTPEELESLLEDGFIQRDTQAIARLFRPNGLLLVDNFSTGDVNRLSAGSEQIRQAAVTLLGRTLSTWLKRGGFGKPAASRY